MVLLVASHSALGKKWGFCELARLLRNKHQFSESELPDWMCLIEHESTFDQAAINKFNSGKFIRLMIRHYIVRLK